MIDQTMSLLTAMALVLMAVGIVVAAHWWEARK